MGQLFMGGLLLVVAVLGVAEGQLAPVGSTVVNALSIAGRLCCTPTGNCLPGSPGLAGVLVNLTCNSAGGSIIVGSGVTGVNGLYNISVYNIGATLGFIPIVPLKGVPCALVTKIPLNQTVCPILQSTTVGTLALVNTVFSQLFGLIANLVLVVFINISTA